MSWLDNKEGWLPTPRLEKKPVRRIQKSLTVTEVAEIFKVDRRTVYRWLSVDGHGAIPDNGWFKLPGGGIRIFEWAVAKIQERE